MAYGVIVYRDWDQERGLQETEAEFHSLDDLFGMCMSITDFSRIDRVVVTGTDEHGHQRSLTFSFRTATGEPHSH